MFKPKVYKALPISSPILSLIPSLNYQGCSWTNLIFNKFETSPCYVIIKYACTTYSTTENIRINCEQHMTISGQTRPSDLKRGLCP